MPGKEISPTIRLPNHWKGGLKSAVLHAVSLAHFAVASARSRTRSRAETAVETERLHQELSLLREELRLKDARMARVAPQRRPHYTPLERMRILELRAARGWSTQQTADTFLLSANTIAEWMKRVDEEGPRALLKISEPVNRFPDFVRYLVQRLKVLCPTLGEVKIAQILARAGLHLAPTTVGRMLKENPLPKPAEVNRKSGNVVTARRPNQVWHVDLTVVPVGGGFWTAWLPGALPQCWPFCWWVAVVVDHFSRRVMGFAVFREQPTSDAVRTFLGRTSRRANAAPKYLICDHGGQFACSGFANYCRRKGIMLRFGAIGEYGSLAVIERFIRTLKDEGTRRLLVPLNREAFRCELARFIEWYNEHRPHTTLAGRTPNEVYHALPPANEQPR